jgi:hypothetical protein
MVFSTLHRLQDLICCGCAMTALKIVQVGIALVLETHKVVENMILDRQLVDCFTVSTVQTVCLSHFGWIWSLDVNARHKQFVKNALKSCIWKGSTTMQHPQQLRKEGRDKSTYCLPFEVAQHISINSLGFTLYSHNEARTHPQKTASRKFSFCKWAVACINPKQAIHISRKQIALSIYLSCEVLNDHCLWDFSKTWNPRLFSVFWKIFKKLEIKGFLFWKKN